MSIKKIRVVWVTILYFCISWVLYCWQMPGYLSSTVKIYSIHGMAEGYYSLYSFLILHTAVLVFYVLLMMQEDQMHVLIRYLDREEVWKIKIYSIIKYIFEFTVLHFSVDIVLLLLVFPVEDVFNSRILIYLMLFFPNVFFYYVFFISVLLMLQTMFRIWKALILTFGMAVLMDVVMCTGTVPAWNPFFFLSLLSIQMQNGVNEADLILSYINILSMDVIIVFMGLKRYHEKDYIP
ncbi:MAG: hypothetical protein K2J67_06970 [Lachnospiraceae bacterium]|nr:hypothetical protein [Lachnospiraceae bacterium]